MLQLQAVLLSSQLLACKHHIYHSSSSLTYHKVVINKYNTSSPIADLSCSNALFHYALCSIIISCSIIMISSIPYHTYLYTYTSSTYHVNQSINRSSQSSHRCSQDSPPGVWGWNRWHKELQGPWYRWNCQSDLYRRRSCSFLEG